MHNNPIDPDTATWRVLPGRSAAHAIVNGHGICGETSDYNNDVLLWRPKARRCQQCLIRLVSGILCKGHKGWGVFDTIDKLVTKRRLWRAWLQEHPL